MDWKREPGGELAVFDVEICGHRDVGLFTFMVMTCFWGS